MAAIINPDNEASTYFQVSFVSQEDQDNYGKLKKEIDKYIDKRIFKNIQNFKNGEPLMSFFDYRSYQLLHPVNEALLPKKICVLDPNTLRDYSGYTHQIYVVSKRFKALVESIEPSVHYFLPLEIVDKKGNHLAQYYFFRCMTVLDSLIDKSEGLEKKDVFSLIQHLKNIDYFCYEYNPISKKKKKINKEKIQDKACFYELHLRTNQPMVPDSVKALLEEKEIGPLVFDPIFTEC